ncbi:MAG: phage tail tape measure protein [Burkholderia gladioli]
MSKMIELGILLSLIDTASSPLRQFGSVLTQTAQGGGNAMQRLGDSFDRASARLTALGASATALGAELTHLAEKPVHAFMEMDTAMNRLAVASLDKTGQVGAGFDQLQKKIIEIDTRLPVTTAQVADTATSLLANGTSMQQMLGGALDAASNLAVVLEMPADEAGTMTARLREAYGLAGTELPKMADLIQRARFAFGISPEELKYASAYSAANLNMLGLTGLQNANKLLAIQGLGAAWNFQGSSFGTNFSMFLTRLSKGPEMIEMAKKGMKGLARQQMIKAGVKFDFYDKKGHLKSIDDMVGQLETAYQKLKAVGGEKMAGDVFSTVFGVEAGRAASLIAQKGIKGYQDAQKRIDDQADIDQRTALIMKRAENIWKVFTSNVTNALAALGQPAVEWAEPMVTKLGDLVAKTREWAKENQRASKIIVLGAGGLGVMLTTFGALTLAAGLFTKLAGGPLRLLGRLLGRRGGKLGTIGHALEGVGVQRVFVVNMPGGGLPGLGGGGGAGGRNGLKTRNRSGGTGRSAGDLFWGGDRAASAERAAESVARPVGRLGRAWRAVRGAPGAVLGRLPGIGGVGRAWRAVRGAPGALLNRVPRLGAVAGRLGSVGRLGGGLLRRLPIIGVGLAGLQVADIAMSDRSAASKKAALTGLGGGLAGSAAGAAIGAVIGSIVPVVGTAIGGVLGSVIGGWAGQKLGDRAGNALFQDRTHAAQQVADRASQRADRALTALATLPAAKAVADKAVPAPKLPDIKVEYKPNVTIMGDPIPGTYQKFDAMLREHQATLAKMVRDIVAAQQRVSFQGR